MSGQVVWVTGAGSGIGRAAAIAFAAAGARVALTGRRVEALAETAALIGEGAVVVAADLADPAEVTRAHAAVVAALGPVDVLFNNAGTNVKQRHWHELAGEAVAAVLGVNLVAPFLCSMAVLPGMRAKRAGTLIHIGSVSGVGLFPASGAVYGASKAGVNMMSAHINAEGGRERHPLGMHQSRGGRDGHPGQPAAAPLGGGPGTDAAGRGCRGGGGVRGRLALPGDGC